MTAGTIGTFCPLDQLAGGGIAAGVRAVLGGQWFEQLQPSQTLFQSGLAFGDHWVSGCSQFISNSLIGY